MRNHGAHTALNIHPHVCEQRLLLRLLQIVQLLLNLRFNVVLSTSAVILFLVRGDTIELFGILQYNLAYNNTPHELRIHYQLK